MKTFRFTIQGRLDGLNEIVKAAKMQRGSYSPYNLMKKESHEIIYYSMLTGISGKLPEFEKINLTFKWFEKNMKRDPDNVAAGGHKFILDTLVAHKVIPNDSMKHVQGWTDIFSIDKENPRIEVIISDATGVVV